MKKTGGALALALLSCVIMLLSVSASASAAALQDMNHDGKVGVTDLAMLMNRNLLKGDTNNDARVDIFDLAAVGLAYGSEPGDPNWNPNADVANTVDRIDVFDLATVGKNFGVQDESPPVLDPPVNVTPGYAGVILGDGFSINITIDSPVTVYAFDVVLLFNSTIMNAVSITEGNFLKKDGASTFSTNSTNNTKGRVNLAVTRIGTQNGISGTGNLATITFNATKAGTGSIGLAGVTLVNELLQTVAGVTTNNGTVVVSSPANQSPQSQWASAASSAEYYNDNWKAAFATGANDGSCNSWKANSAWCKKTASGNGSIELTFSSSVYASGLEIYFNGASQADFDAARVELVKDDGSSDTVWQGTNRNCVLGVTFAAKSYLARKVRVTTKPGYWGCVDAVRLTGYEGNQTACNESWVCSNWGTCIGNQQTRTCIDMNNCSTQNSKPATNQSCNVTCTKNSECGTDGWVGNASCSGNDVFQNWRTYTCNNPGTANASCSNTDTPTLKQDCGSSYCEGWQANYCKGNDVYRKRNCYNKGCSNGACFSDLTIEEEKVSSCQYGCNNGVCASQSPQSQWASAAAAANYYNDAWKAAFAVGVNDGSCNSWKSPSAWCKKALSSNSAIELGFADSVYATALEIHFTGVSAGDFNIDRVELQKPDGSWEVVWQGTNAVCVLQMAFAQRGYLTNRVRVTTKAGNWGCVDAAKLTGYPGSGSCADECTQGQTRCSGDAKQTCGNYDADSCMEWGGDVACQYGCSGGQCNSQACTPGSKRCNGNVVETCKQDGSGWEATQNCENTGYCSGSPASCASCAAGSANCNQNPADACETSLMADSNNCGSCGNACASVQTCQNGQCKTPSQTLQQWASAAAATSYYNDAWKPDFATGANDGSCNSWKSPSAWCKKGIGGTDSITLTFAKKVYASALQAYFTGVSAADFNIDRVEFQKPDGSWDAVWQGTNAQCMLQAAFAQRDYLTDKVRIMTRSWNWGCVDAVKLVGSE